MMAGLQSGEAVKLVPGPALLGPSVAVRDVGGEPLRKSILLSSREAAIMPQNPLRGSSFCQG